MQITHRFSIVLVHAALYVFVTYLQASVDFIIFSYDRPMQLYALLESTEKYLTGIASTTVLYRTSDKPFAMAYKKVQQRFSYAHFIPQSSAPKSDFKSLFIAACKTGSTDYIIFAPDDIIVKKYANLDFCIQKMEQYMAYGFFLRLGSHLDICYTASKIQPLPLHKKVESNLLSWLFKDGILDWGYPNNVDMTIYRKSEVLPALESNSYTSPNTLEASWARSQDTSHRVGLCFDDSIIVNIPVNCVQHDFANNHMKAWTTVQLLELFESGKKIDITNLENIKNRSCHIDYNLTFTDRYL